VNTAISADAVAQDDMFGLIVASGLTLVGEGNSTISGLSLTVRAGEIVGLVGDPDSGTLKCLDLIAGRIMPTYGILKLCGMTVRNEPRRPSVGTNLTSPPVSDTVSGAGWLERLAHQARGYSTVSQDRVGRLLSCLGLGARAGVPLDQYDPEERSLLALAGATVAEPPVVIAHEPLSSLTDERAATVRKLLRRISAAGAAVLISIDPADLERADCDRFYVLKHGRIAARGTIEEVLASGAAGDKLSTL
jgi:ABC-2 type transport system ATP-binding protein